MTGRLPPPLPKALPMIGKLPMTGRLNVEFPLTLPLAEAEPPNRPVTLPLKVCALTLMADKEPATIKPALTRWRAIAEGWRFQKLACGFMTSSVMWNMNPLPESPMSYNLAQKVFLY